MSDAPPTVAEIVPLIQLLDFMFKAVTATPDWNTAGYGFGDNLANLNVRHRDGTALTIWIEAAKP